VDPVRPAAWRIEELEETPSTQDVALNLAAGCAPEGTVVAAGTQTAGRGRSGRPWASPAGGIYMSAVLRPGKVPNPQLLSLVGALAVVRGIRASTGIDSRIRWPNDVLVRGRKVAGVAVEATYSGQSLSFVILGVGLNCNSEPPAVGIRPGAVTSLMSELKNPVDVNQVRRSVLEALGGLYTGWLEGTDVVGESAEVLGTLGRQVIVKSRGGTEISCTALELDGLGGLVVLSEGERIVLRAEDVDTLTEVR
jgi:BirA family transcriptional regulator, biotin operon repressor / biotin---[acetyl-CoA-carboxylase] ligase